MRYVLCRVSPCKRGELITEDMHDKSKGQGSKGDDYEDKAKGRRALEEHFG